MLVCASVPPFHSIQCLNKLNYLSLNFNLYGIFVFTLKVENSCRKMEQNIYITEDESIFSIWSPGTDRPRFSKLQTFYEHSAHISFDIVNVSLPKSIEIIWSTKKDFDLINHILRANHFNPHWKMSHESFRMVRASL